MECVYFAFTMCRLQPVQ